MFEGILLLFLQLSVRVTSKKVFIMQAWIVQLYYKFTTHQAGLQKHTLFVDEDRHAAFSYCEKGASAPGRPTIVFVHGLSSNKETFTPIIKNIAKKYHCITVDLPGHGETVGLNEEIYSIDKFADKLKLFFDRLQLTEPMYIIGASMGGAVVCAFAAKYPAYVRMICLLAPIADEESETELIRRLRAGDSTALLPETPEQLRHMMDTLTVTRPKIPRPFINGILTIRLRLLAEHKKVLHGLLTHDPLAIEQHYQTIRTIQQPTLILWGRDDKVFASTGADFYCKILPHAQKQILDDCGHFLAIDKAVETAELITGFFDANLSASSVSASSNPLAVIECRDNFFQSTSTAGIQIMDS